MFAFILHNMYSDIIYVVLFMKQSVAVLNRPYVLMSYLTRVRARADNIECDVMCMLLRVFVCVCVCVCVFANLED